MPPFFAPLCPTESEEASYAHLANDCDRKVPSVGRRVYSISFEDHGIVWTATIGEHLKDRKTLKVKGKETVEWQIDDPALVIAVFPPLPYCIITYSKGKSRLQQTFHATGIELFTI